MRDANGVSALIAARGFKAQSQIEAKRTRTKKRLCSARVRREDRFGEAD